MEEIILSIVIVSKNEELKIEKCLKSIFTLKMNFPFEVILVDSNSTDKTIEIAKKYPIKIYQLGKYMHCSAAVGRYVGSKLSKGKYVLFLDADMEIGKNTNMEKAIKFLEENPKVGAISGKLIERVYDDNGNLVEDKGDIYRVKDYERRSDMGGAVLFKKKILYEIGNVDVTLDGNEDIDLQYRLSKNGYLFYRISDLIFIHNTKNVCNMNVINSRFKRGRFRDMWRVGLRSLKYGYFFHHVVMNSFYYYWAFYLTLSILIVTLYILGKISILFLLVDFLLFITVVCYKICKKGLKKGILDIYCSTLCFFGLFQINRNSSEVDLNKLIPIKE